jgi:hypothetical protein
MTTHHNIQIIKTKTDLKVTYRDGKFRKLEHLRGSLDQTMLNALGKVVPQKESDLDAFVKGWDGKVVYTSEENKPVTIYSQFNSSWFAFFRKENNNIPPKFTAADGKSLKQIINYLISINNGNETAALENWNLLLNSWNSLSNFHQSQTDLKYINSKLNVIIREIIRNNGVNTSGDNSSVSI